MRRSSVYGAHENTKTLGLSWNFQNDRFTYFLKYCPTWPFRSFYSISKDFISARKFIKQNHKQVDESSAQSDIERPFIPPSFSTFWRFVGDGNKECQALP